MKGTIHIIGCDRSQHWIDGETVKMVNQVGLEERTYGRGVSITFKDGGLLRIDNALFVEIIDAKPKAAEEENDTPPEKKIDVSPGQPISSMQTREIQIPSVGLAQLQRLHFDTFEQIASVRSTSLARVEGIGTETIKALRRLLEANGKKWGKGYLRGIYKPYINRYTKREDEKLIGLEVVSSKADSDIRIYEIKRKWD